MSDPRDWTPEQWRVWREKFIASESAPDYRTRLSAPLLSPYQLIPTTWRSRDTIPKELLDRWRTGAKPDDARGGVTPRPET